MLGVWDCVGFDILSIQKIKYMLKGSYGIAPITNPRHSSLLVTASWVLQLV